jgi:hypothetical protein
VDAASCMCDGLRVPWDQWPSRALFLWACVTVERRSSNCIVLANTASTSSNKSPLFVNPPPNEDKAFAVCSVAGAPSLARPEREGLSRCLSRPTFCCSHATIDDISPTARSIKYPQCPQISGLPTDQELPWIEAGQCLEGSRRNTSARPRGFATAPPCEP